MEMPMDYSKDENILEKSVSLATVPGHQPIEPDGVADY